MKKFSYYLEGVEFTIETDHQALTWLSRLDQPSGRLARWAMTIQGYRMNIIYKRGKYNQQADALSRAPVNSETFEQTSEKTVTQTQETARVVSIMVWPLPFSKEELISAQTNDTWLTQISNNIIRNQMTDTSKGKKGVEVYAKSNDNILIGYFPTENDNDETAWKMVIPEKLKRATLEYFHDASPSGHLGINKTLHRLRQYVTWTRMRKDVYNYVIGCDACQKAKSSNLKAPGLLYSNERRDPWTDISIDFIGPFPASSKQNKYVLVVTDHYTRWVEAFPMRKATTEKVIEYLTQVFLRFGFPRTLLSDNATVFTSKLMIDWCDGMNIYLKHTIPYHPQANPTERTNKTLKQMIITYTDKHRSWDDKISHLIFALNTAVNESTGFTPAFLNFARELRTPWKNLTLSANVTTSPQKYTHFVRKLIDSMSQAKLDANENMVHAQVRQKLAYDNSHREVKYKINDLVLYETHEISDALAHFSQKLAKKWEGPYKIVKAINNQNFEIQKVDDPDVIKRAHTSQIKIYRCNKDCFM